MILLCPRGQERFIRWIAALFTFPQLLIAGWLYANFDTTTTSIQFAEHRAWIPAYHIFYFPRRRRHQHRDGVPDRAHLFHRGIRELQYRSRQAGYFALLLLLETGMIGVFVALDFVLFYVFWEVMLVPMYFLIGVWGGPRREYAAIKFFLYTLIGSVFMLLGDPGAVLLRRPRTTFDMIELAANAGGAARPPVQRWLFLALFLGFAVKIPVFPFHTWLPDAHVEAPDRRSASCSPACC